MDDFLIIDVGGADLVLEINVESATFKWDRSGTSKTRAYSGKPQVTVTYADKGIWNLTAKPLTTDEYQALVAAADWPETITIGGELLRITSNNAVPQTVDCTLLIEDFQYMPVGGTDFLHVPKLTIEQD